jgi:hypothetical protein
LTSRLRRGRPTPWGLLALLGLLLLAVLGGLAGRDGKDGFLFGLPAGLWAVIQEPVVLAVLAAATVIWVIYASRRALLWRLATAPGPVVLTGVENATSQRDLPVRDMSITFQQHLSRAHLTAAGMPGGAPAVPFLHLLKETELDVKKPFGFVGGVLGLALPTHAYELKLTLLDREETDGCGVLVELLVVPAQMTMAHRYWAPTWDRAVERAANESAALLLPRTRRCTGPWSAWRWRVLPGPLFDSYEQARQMLEERRLEEALAHYYDALRQDPSNAEIGFELGLAQERMGLWLDALLSYHRVFRPRPRPRRPWPESLPGRRITRRADALARYRYLKVLGFGERLAGQWVTTGDRPSIVDSESSLAWTLRDDERREVRRQLREILRHRYATLSERELELAIGPDDRRAGPRHAVRNLISRALADPPPGGDAQQIRREQESRLRVLFVVFAEHEARRLLHDSRFQSFHRLGVGITRLSIEITGVLNVRRRERFQGKPLVIPTGEEDGLDELLFGAKLAARIRRSRQYADHYNAACAFAIPLLLIGPRRGRLESRERNAAISHAVRELHAAIDAADPGVVAGRRHWILSEDPDLAELRKTSAFRTFEIERFPSSHRVAARPRDVHQYELSEHAANLVATSARRIEREWHRRGEQAAVSELTDIHVIQSWWEEETENWEQIRRFAVDHRDWRTRLEWVRRIQSFALRHGQAPYTPRYPNYEDAAMAIPESGSGRDLDDAAIRRVKAATQRMVSVAGILSARAVDEASSARRWHEHLMKLDDRGRTLSRDALRTLCESHAALWAVLARMFESPLDSRESVDAAIDRLTAAFDDCPLPPAGIGVIVPTVSQVGDMSDDGLGRTTRRFVPTS